MEKPKHKQLKSIMLEDLKTGDKFKTSLTYNKRIVFWQVVQTKRYRVPTPAGFPEKWETRILAQSLNSAKRRQFTGSNLVVYIED